MSYNESLQIIHDVFTNCQNSCRISTFSTILNEIFYHNRFYHSYIQQENPGNTAKKNLSIKIEEELFIFSAENDKKSKLVDDVNKNGTKIKNIHEINETALVFGAIGTSQNRCVLYPMGSFQDTCEKCFLNHKCNQSKKKAYLLLLFLDLSFRFGLQQNFVAISG